MSTYIVKVRSRYFMNQNGIDWFITQQGLADRWYDEEGLADARDTARRIVAEAARGDRAHVRVVLLTSGRMQ